MGLGGGFFMTIWDANNKTAIFLDARETAPMNATEDMFNGNAHLSMYGRIFLQNLLTDTYTFTSKLLRSCIYNHYWMQRNV